ncbi:MAG: thrombospondin type 3 repeat-containing protein, partial [Ignavibacteria bacterium]|nr:thrombospondin type 3 repeat-containing protein [Ignavibacteria bacterium]
MGTYKNFVLDHCSFSWSIDECVSFYGNENFTMQWCLISESLYNSFHTKGKLGYGGLWVGKNASYHHNLLAHHTSRNPRFAGGETATCVNLDFRNNVIYNWGFNSAYGGEEGTINMVANYYKAGKATSSSTKYRIVEPSANQALGKGPGKFFVDQNFVFGSPTISANNWSGGVQGSFVNDTSIKAKEPFSYEPINIQTAEEAYASVLQHVGACLPKRDGLDARIINETETGTAAFGASYGAGKGIIDSQEGVGGWPVLNSTTPPVDTDKDGMPDNWELAKGLDPNNSLDRNSISTTGYTNLEDYLNELGNVTTSINDDEVKVADDYKLLQNYPNPFNPST